MSKPHAHLLATAHGLMADSDSGKPWATGIYAGALGAVALGTAWRGLAQPSSRPARRAAVSP